MGVNIPRQGLTRERILEKAIDIINKRGYNTLSLAMLSSELNVKAPALFKHYRNFDDLKENLTLFGIQSLKQKLQDAVTGKAGEQALFGLCHSYRDFAKTNSGIYQAIQPAYFKKGKEIEQAAVELMTIILNVVKGFDIDSKHYIHALRVIRSSLHGFVVMEIEFGFGMSANIDQSFEHQINALIFMIKSFRY